MGQYAGSNAAWLEEIYQYEQTDPVQGGPDGKSNKPLKDLADRTAWLKGQLGKITRLSGEQYLSASGDISQDKGGNLISINANGIINLTLEDAALFPHGAFIPFLAFCTPGSVVNIKTKEGQVFFNPVTGAQSILNMHHNEDLTIIALTDHFKVLFGNGNFTCVGEEIKARKERLNTLAFKGQLVSRSQYPRLWKYVDEELTMYQEVVTEQTWNADPVNYRGFFTKGDGLTNFRLPDERGMHERMLDLGRGIDFGLNSSYAGGYGKDEVKQHGHRLRNGTGGSSTNSLNNPVGGIAGMDALAEWLGDKEKSSNWIEATGGAENTVKRIGKLHLIKF